MKIKIIVSNSGEFKDVDFEDPPMHIPMVVEVVQEEE
tara:strand:- start:938 stop:1048 length:111 start_codon:yes stop_codon:yes gene_type:complete